MARTTKARGKPRRQQPKRGGRDERARRSARPAPRSTQAKGRRKPYKKRAPHFAPSERVFHTVTAERDSAGNQRASALTSCCGQPSDKVYGVAFGRESFAPGEEVAWCPKAVLS